MQIAIPQEASLQNLHNLFQEEFPTVASEQTNKGASTQVSERRPEMLQ